MVLLFLSPLFFIISLLIILDSNGGIFYKQKRVGRNKKEFWLIKFRTMVKEADKKGLLTIGTDDKRITKVGKYLRRYKLDELPQLINIIKGDMSVVGPRPEVLQYVLLYNEQQKKVLALRPGLTDLASLEFINENEILSNYSDSEKAYIEIILPQKLQLNLNYISHQSLWGDIVIIIRTIFKIVK